MITLQKEGDPWHAWIENNKALFAGLNPSAKIGFIIKEVFENLKGKAVILKTSETEERLVVKEVEFAGFRALPVDIVFIAGLSTLEIIKDNVSLYHLLKNKEVLFFTLKTSAELKEKGYAEFLDTIGLEFLGT